MELAYGQRTEAWLEARKGRITASLASACLQVDPLKSARAAWREILGRGTATMNRHMAWGVEREAEARDTFEAMTGMETRPSGLWVSDVHPWLAGSPDALIGDLALLEIKCPKTAALPTSVPVHHRIQMLVQLIVTGRSLGLYFAWKPSGAYLGIVRPAGTKGLIQKLYGFYARYVLTETEPPLKRRKRQKDEIAVESHGMAHAYPFPQRSA